MGNRIISDEIEREKFFEIIEKNDETKGKQLLKFMRWCYEKGFLNNIRNRDIDFCFEYGILSLPLLSNHHISIGVNVFNNDYIQIGIDPSDCFNKVSQCSIIARLPFTSKREEYHFYKLLETLLDNKNPLTKEWRKIANISWYGAYVKYNC